MNLIFFYKISLRLGVKSLDSIHKRFMFKRGGNIENLKKSGDLISVAENKIIIKTGNNINSLEANLRSLDLANNIEKQQQCIIERVSNSTTTISIKDVNKGIVYPMKINRNFAFYGKFNKNYTVNSLSKDNVIEFSSFLKFKSKAIADAEIALKQKKIEKEQFLTFIKRFDALDLSYVHATIGDIVHWRKPLNEDSNEEYIKIMYHIITTKATIVDYGGPNKFNPIFLYHDKTTGITYYTIPLTYILSLKREEYITYFVSKNKKVFKNDTIEVQNQLATNIKTVSEINKFKMLDINEKCINTLPSDIDPNEVFPDSIYSNDITSFVPDQFFLLD